MNKDTVVGILGAVILVAAMVGIFCYEGTQAPGAAGGTGGTGGTGGGPPGATFREAAVTGTPSAQGAGAAGTPDEGDLVINATNLARVEFTVTWTDDVNDPTTMAGNDQVTLTITTPENRSLPAAQSTNGTLTVLVAPLCTNPANATTGSPCTLGSGRYHYRVEVQGNGAAPLPIPGAIPIADNGNAWAMGTRATQWQAGNATAAR